MYQNQQQQTGQHNPWACGPHSGRCGGHAMKARWKAAMAQRFGGWAGPAANIEERDEAFIISIYAAGIRKEDVTIRVKDDVLEAVYQPSGVPGAGGPEYASREHTETPWKRRFLLNGKALTEGITAGYTDGVLRITLPKNPDTNTKPVTVAVS
jgi:HSP20 family protein